MELRTLLVGEYRFADKNRKVERGHEGKRIQGKYREKQYSFSLIMLPKLQLISQSSKQSFIFYHVSHKTAHGNEANISTENEASKVL